jgi:glycosyltransferase involved in cell wall biosynthesis
MARNLALTGSLPQHDQAGTTPGEAASISGEAVRPSIVFVSTALLRGGAETQVTLLASGLARRDWCVRVVSMRPPEAYVEELAAAGVEVVSLGMRRRVPDPRGVLRLARYLRAWRPDIVHGHMVHANLLTRVTRPLAPVPVLVSTAHNVIEGPRWREVAYRLTDALSDLTTNVSAAAVDRYVQIHAAPEHKIRCVPNGIDLSRFRRDEVARRRLRDELGIADRSVLLAAGRLESAKDYPTMLRALSLVAREHPNILLLIAGTGTLEPEVRQLVAELDLGPHVRLLGARTDVPALMSAADLYVLSSAWEGLPLVLIEAAAVELPIVATDVGGNREVVRHEDNGLIVFPQDPRALASAIGQVLNMPPEARQRWGAAGRRLVEREYDIDRVLDRWEGIYREFLEPARAVTSR